MLEAMRIAAPQARFYQASSLEMFGRPDCRIDGARVEYPSAKPLSRGQKNPPRLPSAGVLQVTHLSHFYVDGLRVQ
jgi:GDP-D-mannose dehydratase